MKEHMTLQEIADLEGLTKQSVADILERAMRKVRIALLNRGIKIEDLL